MTGQDHRPLVSSVDGIVKPRAPAHHRPPEEFRSALPHLHPLWNDLDVHENRHRPGNSARLCVLPRQIASALRTHPDGAIFTSLFHNPKSVICAATLLAETGDCRARLSHRRRARRRRRPSRRRDRIR